MSAPRILQWPFLLTLSCGWLLQSWGAVHGAEPTAKWSETRVIAAPEAGQAAAADGEFVYAITNSVVAKYDRQTGERVAVSEGPAKHLNSGFFWQGKLYCAHSNYPQMPELSEIKVLDCESMQLTTFKDFGNFGGSLTWAIRKNSEWWCNFARYGDNNRETFLVRFNENWEPLERWTYPPAVLDQLGTFSLSGGIWYRNDLLVTGHDDPVIFRLRLPKQGNVLEFVDQQTVPFTGQGIAFDPVTGGMIGISRAKKQIVCAQQEDSRSLKLRVMSYNIHHAEGVDQLLDVARIANVIKQARPDLVSLQEVDRGVKRTDSVDQAAELARMTGLHLAFGANIGLQGGVYGNAVLSRWPFCRHENARLPNLDRGEPRGLLACDIDLPDGRLPLLFLATHFDHRRPDEERLASAKYIEMLMAQQPDRPALLLGDLNAPVDSPVMQEISKTWLRTNVDPLPTVPVAEPRYQIDYVLLRHPEYWRIIRTEVLSEDVASDHRAIVADLELLPARQK